MGENLVTHLGHCITAASELVGGNLSLVYYSHIPTVAITLLMGIFVLRASKGSLQSKIFFSFCVVFSLWVVANFVAWIGTSSVWISFFWSLLGLSDIIFYVLGLYFFYVFVENKDTTFRLKIILSAILIPFLILAPTKLNLPGFDYTNCAAIDTSFLGYLFYAKMFIAGWLIVLSIYKYKKSQKSERPKIILLSIGLALFFLSFFVTGYIADTYLRYDIELYGLYAMTAFMGILAYLIVKYKAFDIKLLGAQALVYSLIILLGAQFLFIKSQINMVLTGIALFLTIIFGYYLILGIKKEIAQKEEIQRLATSLARSNDQLVVANEKLKELDKQKTEFVSLASHQLRSPLTAIKGYSSMILEGSFGKINEKAKEAVGRVFESSQKLVLVIEDFLNITRIELGRMKYDVSEFSFNKLVTSVIGEQKPNVERRGLAISYEEDAPEYKVFADFGKISQVISNIVDNAVKYSKEGSIAVKVVGITDGKDKKVRLSVKDTGVGIEPQVLPHLFQKFVRAYDAGKTNIIGTGLGLFVAKQIVDSHPGGKIWAESEGKNKGSTFFVELSLSTGVAPVLTPPPADPAVAEPASSSATTTEPPIPQPTAGDLS